LAHFSAPPDAHLELDITPTRDARPPNTVCDCLKMTFSGSTSYGVLMLQDDGYISEHQLISMTQLLGGCR